ncbi:MAG: transcriptional regulator, AraC family [Betaproteobacteria bacterium]|nr:transcriptional regulator, AraC family [Betaproteobacteria bacterium]
MNHQNAHQNFDHYHARFRKVLEYIDAHLDEALNVEVLAGVAAFSKFHFHRQFSDLLGLGVMRYLQLRRLRRASYQLAYHGDRAVIEIALASGYEGPEAFARAFKKNVGQTPSDFRKQPQWEPWTAAFAPVAELRRNHMPPPYQAADVRIVDTTDIRVAAIEHRGDPRSIGDSIRKCIAWRRAHGLPPSKSAHYNVFYDDPVTTPPQDFRLEICAATDMEIAPDDADVVAKVIPGGRCAVLRHTGTDDTLGHAIAYLYRDWLPLSGEELRDFPVYAQRLTFFPEVPEHEAVTDVFLPLAPRT